MSNDGPGPNAQPRSRLLPAADHQEPGQRSFLLEVVARLVHPSILIVAVYLLFAGLHHPGGGFAAGLVAALGLVLRRLAGGPHELGAAAPVAPGTLLGAGLVLTAGYAIAGVVFTDELLAGAKWSIHAPLIGRLEIATSLVFEVGIALIILGLVLDVLRTLGDSRSQAENEETGS